MDGCKTCDIKWFPALLGSLGPTLIPPAHITVLWYFWGNYTYYVDRENCTCSCWDTVFKGPYESGEALYKHMYFNATATTFKIWLITVIGIIVFYECIKHLIVLIKQNRIRYSMLVLFCLSIFSHYYSWWMYINYYNDEFYKHWNHQLFFTITEILSSVLVINMANNANSITSRKIFGIVGIGLVHIAAGSCDQFISNVLLGNGRLEQQIRDIWLMVPDIMQVVIPLWMLRKTRKNSRNTKPFLSDYALHREIMAMLLLGMTVFIICTFFITNEK